MCRIFEKLFCLHDWEMVHVVQYENGDSILMKCKKCGKLVEKFL